MDVSENLQGKLDLIYSMRGNCIKVMFKIAKLPTNACGELYFYHKLEVEFCYGPSFAIFDHDGFSLYTLAILKITACTQHFALLVVFVFFLFSLLLLWLSLYYNLDFYL